MGRRAGSVPVGSQVRTSLRLAASLLEGSGSGQDEKERGEQPAEALRNL